MKFERACRQTTLLAGGLMLALGGGLVVNAWWLEAKAWLAQELLGYAWSQTLAGDEQVRPWPWAEIWPVARLTTPSGEQLYVLEGFSGEALAFGPGRLPGSSMAGMPGAMVLAGHQDSHFRFLQTLSVGEEVMIQTAGGDLFRYRVKADRVVDSRRQRIDIESDVRDRLILITCFPFGAGFAGTGSPFRLEVEAVRI